MGYGSFPLPLRGMDRNDNMAKYILLALLNVNFIVLVARCCCLPTPMTLASGGGIPMFPLVVHQPASPSIWSAVPSLRRGLSTNPGVTMWCICGCS